MINILSYLLEVTVALFILYMLYFILLKNETNYQLIRFFLIASVLGGFLMPLMKFNIGVAQISEDFSLALPEVSVLATDSSQIAQSSISWYEILLFGYLIGFGLSVYKFLSQLIRIHTLKKHSERGLYKGYPVFYTSNTGTTFSFYNCIYVDKSQPLSDKELKQILDHETIHLKQYHTLDILLMEIAKMIFWFNPMIYLFQSAIKNTHEFIADSEVLKSNNQPAYIKLLVKQALNNVGLSLGNHFGSPSNNPIGSNKSITLKRIKMMKKRDQKMKRFKYLIPVMAFSIVFAVVSCEQNETNEQVTPVSQSEVVTEPDEMPSYDEGISAMYQFIGSNIKYPLEARSAGVEGKVYAQFVVDQDGNVQGVKILKTYVSQGVLDEIVVVGYDGNQEELIAENQQNISLLEEEVERVVSTLPAWNPGKKDGKIVSVQMVLPVTFKID